MDNHNCIIYNPPKCKKILSILSNCNSFYVSSSSFFDNSDTCYVPPRLTNINLIFERTKLYLINDSSDFIMLYYDYQSGYYIFIQILDSSCEELNRVYICHDIRYCIDNIMTEKQRENYFIK